MRKRLWFVLPALVLLAGAGWAVWAPHPSSLRNFDPAAVGQLEARMWRSYYEHREKDVFRDMTTLLREQYKLPWLRSYGAAYQVARAAFVFKRGRVRTDYEKALPPLRRYYRAIRSASDTPFDAERAAELEMEWWIVHRQRESHAPEDLEKALADLQAVVYAVPAERFAEHARLRAEAMRLRDTREAEGTVSEADWQRIDELLRQSWDALLRAVRS